MDIINCSLGKEWCPEDWKILTIIPIPKVEKVKKASKHRPINMLPVFEKVLELVKKTNWNVFGK